MLSSINSDNVIWSITGSFEAEQIETSATAERKPMFYTVDEVSSRYKVSTKTIWRWVREGRFPRPVKVGPGTTRWREEDLQAFEEGLQ
ncbi:hypothetical protein Q672_19220 [Marinobacter sp. EVN1]|jgi:prophage regulatory protein|nr:MULTISPECIES: helix-turn-helix domain-containing protein [unclassified Marinobacter]ERS11632.1 hypothetical protein Q673_10640 [Marinobacter sp. EN3]ERS84656.1 hypothetical protein Q672_19220 [Marinobacter sp. EVN1]